MRKYIGKYASIKPVKGGFYDDDYRFRKPEIRGTFVKSFQGGDAIIFVSNDFNYKNGYHDRYNVTYRGSFGLSPRSWERNFNIKIIE